MSPHVFERLSAFMDEELPAEERAAVQEHLGACRECARRLEEMAAVDTMARELTNQAPDGYFEILPGRVRARLPARPAPTRLGVAPWAWAVAAGLLLAILTPLTWRERPLPSAPPALEAPPSVPAPARIPPATAQPQMASARATEPTAGVPLDQLAAVKKEAKPQRERAFAAPPRETKTTAADLPSPPAEPLAERPATPGKNAPAAAPLPTAAPAGAVAPRAAIEADAAATRGRAGAATGEEAQVKAKNATPLKTAGARDDEVRAKGFTAAARDAASPEERQFQELLARASRTLAEARSLREAWRAYSRIYSSGRFADEARVRAVEACATAYRLGRDAADLATAREDAAAYLERGDAAQAARVRMILASLEP